MSRTSESTLYSCLNVKELLDIQATSESEIWKTDTKFPIYFSKNWLTVEEVGLLCLFNDSSLENLGTSLITL